METHILLPLLLPQHRPKPSTQSLQPTPTAERPGIESRGLVSGALPCTSPRLSDGLGATQPCKHTACPARPAGTGARGRAHLHAHKPSCAPGLPRGLLRQLYSPVIRTTSAEVETEVKNSCSCPNPASAKALDNLLQIFECFHGRLWSAFFLEMNLQ